VTQNTIVVGTTTVRVRRSAACNAAFANTAIVVSFGAGVTGCFEDTVNSQAIAAHDRVSLMVSLPAGAGAVVALTAGLEFEY